MAFPFLSAIPVIGGMVNRILDIVEKFVPDKDLQTKISAEISMAALTMDHSEWIKVIEGQTDIIKAEANASSWLTRSWRPMVMMVFTGLVVSHWVGYSPPNMTEATLNRVFDLIQLGLGGYIVGRSAEKVIPQILKAVKK